MENEKLAKEKIGLLISILTSPPPISLDFMLNEQARHLIR